MKNRPFHERLAFSLKGVNAAWQRENSFRTQIGIGALVIFVLAILRPSLIWWAIIILAISLVLATELLNSAFEALIDHLHPERHPEIGIIKDIAAGGVLISSLGAIVVGLLLLAAILYQ